MKNRTAILMPAYNPDPVGLGRTLQSLKHQTAPADIVIIDDGSSPPVANLIDDSAIKILRLPQNRGIVEALNIGLTDCIEQGYSYIARMDCGDLCLPDRIAAQQAFMDNRQEVDLLGCHAEIVDASGRYLFTEGTTGGEASVKRKLFDNAAFKHPAFFLRTRSVVTLGLYSDRYRHAEDYEFARRYAARGHIECLDAVLIVYEKTTTGLSNSHRGAQLRSRLRVQLLYFEPGRFNAYLGVLRTIVTLLVPARLWARASILYWRARGTTLQASSLGSRS